MSKESNGGGSDLDIFEGLGKKSSEHSPTAPPSPPGSSSHIGSTRPAFDAKRTLLGIPGPAASQGTPVAPPSTRPANASAPAPASPPASGSMRAALPASKAPPPPPGRDSLPNLADTKSSPSVEAAAPSGMPKPPSAPPPLNPRASVAPPTPSARASSAPSTTPSAALHAHAKNGAKLEMDWDDDDEATHVFDKEREKSSAESSSQALAAPDAPEPERANMDAILSSPPPRTSPLPAPPPATSAAAPVPPASAPPATLSGAFGALGQPRDPKVNGSAPPSANPGASAPARSMPPPPPMSHPPASHKSSTQPMQTPPPPPPGQVKTAPMHMPAQRPASVPPPANTLQSARSPIAGLPLPPPSGAPTAQASVPPTAIPPAPNVPNLPPVSRAMEATQMVPRAASKSPLWIAPLLAVAAIAGAAVFFLMPRSGTLVVNVADAKGGAVSNLEVVVDGTKRCDNAPCIVRDIPAGVHEVQVTAKGYEPLAPRAVTVESGRDVPTEFQLLPSKAAAGTGFKVAATHPGVKLTVDGKDLGPLPQEMRNLEPGDHKLRFAGDRYVPLEKTITVAKDEIVDLGTVNLKVAKGKATIQLGTPGAKVYLVNGTNRKEVPQFPMAIEFDPNETWELQGTKDNFDDYRERISFDDGQAEKTFTVTLAPKGTAARAIAPTPKEQAIAARPVRDPATPKEPAAPKKEATAGEAMLKINSLPASSIVLDGKPIGPTPQLNVSVSPGSHTILFINSELSLKKTITVDVKAGETKAAFAKLRE